MTVLKTDRIGNKKNPNTNSYLLPKKTTAVQVDELIAFKIKEINRSSNMSLYFHAANQLSKFIQIFFLYIEKLPNLYILQVFSETSSRPFQ